MKKNTVNDTRELLYKYVKDHYWSVRNSSSHTLSTTCRQLALGEGGLCWLVKSSACSSPISSQVNLVLILLVLFFAFDATQYLISSIRYKDLAEKYDDEILNGKIEKLEELIEPKKINTAPQICFILKLFILILTSVFLICLILKI